MSQSMFVEKKAYELCVGDHIVDVPGFRHVQTVLSRSMPERNVVVLSLLNVESNETTVEHLHPTDRFIVEVVV